MSTKSSITGTTPGWDWIVHAKAGQGKEAKSVSPEDKLVCSYGFAPVFSVTHRIEVRVTFDGTYELAANQKGAGGRRAQAGIFLDATITQPGKKHPFPRKTIFNKKVTKSSDAGPFKHVYFFTADADLEAESATVIDMRVLLLANVKWNGSLATLDFRKVGGAGIKFGPCVVSPKVAQPGSNGGNSGGGGGPVITATASS